ncbi:MAG: flagellar biosynthetic protein FliO [Agathobacter sp.]|nr:flagellar biosynthetic protein FliO [Agathobacter sp.]
MNILLTSTLESFGQLIWVLLIFVFVLALTYYVTRWIGGYQKTHFCGKNLKMIETMRIGNNKMISIVRAGSKYLVVAVGKDEMQLLAELSQDEIQEATAEMPDTQENFQSILNNLKDKLPKKQG